MSLFLVTGGAGFIGSHLVTTLLERGDQVRVLDNFATGKREHIDLYHGRAGVVEGDVRDHALVERLMAGVDYVLHLAAVVSVPQSMRDPALTNDVNVNGTLNVLAAARKFNVKRVVFSSSCAVYGDNPELPLSERSITQPLSPYAASKLIGEVYCQTYYRAYGLPTVCLRYFNIYGPRQDPNGDYAAVIPKFVQRLKAGQAPLIYGAGQQTRDFVYVGDVVRANLLACEHPQASGRVFNIASGQGTSLLELAASVNGLTPQPIQPQFAPPREGDILHSRGDGTCAHTTLGFQPTMGLNEGLKQLYDSINR
ncbi:UDP-glucose 4-epimerase [Thermoflexales bacterium]|nr:UDP-glucose 4-epimerase [Thermoflexales bacterium]